MRLSGLTRLRCDPIATESSVDVGRRDPSHKPNRIRQRRYVGGMAGTAESDLARPAMIPGLGRHTAHRRLHYDVWPNHDGPSRDLEDLAPHITDRQHLDRPVTTRDFEPTLALDHHRPQIERHACYEGP